MARKKSGVPLEGEGLDRRSFLKISSVAAVAAAVAVPVLAGPEEAKKAAQPAKALPGKPNLKGGWFSV
jgi:anaerobic selenocysteine-containing dehydrogenase